jgi:hypothetical protein
MSNCSDECDLDIHVVRLQELRVAESGPVEPTVLLFDLN